MAWQVRHRRITEKPGDKSLKLTTACGFALPFVFQPLFGISHHFPPFPEFRHNRVSNYNGYGGCGKDRVDFVGNGRDCGGGGGIVHAAAPPLSIVMSGSFHRHPRPPSRGSMPCFLHQPPSGDHYLRPLCALESVILGAGPLARKRTPELLRRLGENSCVAISTALHPFGRLEPSATPVPYSLLATSLTFDIVRALCRIQRRSRTPDYIDRASRLEGRSGGNTQSWLSS